MTPTPSLLTPTPNLGVAEHWCKVRGGVKHGGTRKVSHFNNLKVTTYDLSFTLVFIRLRIVLLVLPF